MVKTVYDITNFYRKQWVWLILIKVGALTIRGLDKLLSPIFWIWSWKPVKKIPCLDHKIYEVSATKLARMIRGKEISSEEVVRRYINRINKVNHIINAVVQDRFNEAIHEASTVDEWLKQTSLSIREIEKGYPLLGVPITVKESCKLKDMSFSVGINTRKGMIADNDGEAVKRVKLAGGIPLLVSNTPEICFGIEVNNFITGRCNNPYNTNYTCGGSSGGEGALLGSACSILGIASDLACSIRLPALFNGIFGHKPTECLVPMEDHHPYIDDDNFRRFLVIGPMARYAEDLRLLLNVLADNKIDLKEKVEIKDINIYYTEKFESPFYISDVSQEVKGVIRKCALHLKNRSCKINNVKLFDMDKCFDMSTALFFGMKNKPDLLLDENNPSKRYSLFVEFFKLLFNKSSLYYNALSYDFMVKTHSLLTTNNNSYYEDMFDDVRKNLINTLGPNGVILYPTMPGAAFQHGASLFNAADLIYSMMFNILGFPSTQVPMGLNKKGLPIGIQVIACPERDAVCLSVAEELEAKFGGWVPPS